MHYAENAKSLIDAMSDENPNYEQCHLILFFLDKIWRLANQQKDGYIHSDKILLDLYENISSAPELPDFTQPTNAFKLLPSGIIAFVVDGPTNPSTKASLTGIVDRKLIDSGLENTRHWFIETKWDGIAQLPRSLALAMLSLHINPQSQSGWLYAASQSILEEFYSTLDGKLEDSEFILHYQPTFNNQKEVVGAEALIRWRKDGKIIYPDEFIPHLYRLDVVDKLDQWVLDKAVEKITNWWPHIGHKEFRLSINISPKFISSERLFRSVSKLDSSIRHKLEVEILEQFDLAAANLTSEQVRCIQNLGISVALDDFGTGQANYSSLRYLPNKFGGASEKAGPAKIKIDQRFVLDKEENDSHFDPIVCETVSYIGNKLQLSVAAEGVETIELFDKLKDMNVHIFQGYALAKPMDESSFKNEFLQN